MAMNSRQIKEVLTLICQNKDKEGLWRFINEAFGAGIPRVAVCPDHSAPFDFVADYMFGNFSDGLVLANRSGGKTTDFAILDALVSFVNDNTEIATVGAIQPQAQRCYEYFLNFCKKDPFNSNLLSPTMNRTLLRNGSIVQILTGTLAGVNSPHPQKVFLDEIDLMLWQVLQQALSMAQSNGDVRAQTVLTSTHKFANGAMQKMLDESSERSFKLYKWCIWEVVKPLPVNDPQLLGEVRAAFEELPAKIEQADGYYLWQDLISKYKQLDSEVWETEWLCKRPGLEGIIYANSYSDDENLIGSFNPQDKNGQIYLFEDFGYGEGHPDVVLFVWIPPEFNKIIIFDELYLTNLSTPEIWDVIEGKLAEYKMSIYENVRGWIGDPHGLTELADRRNRGAPILEKADDPQLYLVNNGIPIVRKYFKSSNLMITRKCVNLRLELLSYKRRKNTDGSYSPQAEKKNDHGPDALRYGLIILNPSLQSNTFPDERRGTELSDSGYVENKMLKAMGWDELPPLTMDMKF